MIDSLQVLFYETIKFVFLLILSLNNNFCKIIGTEQVFWQMQTEKISNQDHLAYSKIMRLLICCLTWFFIIVQSCKLGLAYFEVW